MDKIIIILPDGEEWYGKPQEKFIPNYQDGNFVLEMEQGYAIIGSELIKKSIIRVIPE